MISLFKQFYLLGYNVNPIKGTWIPVVSLLQTTSGCQLQSPPIRRRFKNHSSWLEQILFHPH